MTAMERLITYSYRRQSSDDFVRGVLKKSRASTWRFIPMTIASLAAVTLLWFTLTAPQDDPLLRQLGDDDPEKREAAYTELVKRGDAARPILEKALTSKNPDVSGRAAKGLRAIDYAKDLKARDAWKEKAKELLGRTGLEINAALIKLRGAPIFDPDYWGDKGGDHRIYWLDDAWQLTIDYKDEVAVTATVSGIADENVDEELYPALKTVHNAPKVEGYSFNPLGLIRAVNTLHALGKEKALAVLRAYHKLCRGNRDAFDEQRIFLIVRVLFEHESGTMPRMNIGGPDVSEEGWPLFPITLVDDVPFMVCNGYSLAGKAESPTVHIDYAETSCKLRATPLAPKSSPAVAAANLLNAHAGIKPYHRDEIQRQAIRTVEPILNTTGFSDLERWKKFAEGPQPAWDGKRWASK